ncbi:hypothetical protein Gasu2_41130 [Galdieria sulphuraria]|nr:hypothetical protein Gasu2_41130 [Galdieria sulphuraria]
MVSATLSSMSRASLWLTRFFLYTVILAFSIAIDGVMGKKGDNVWNTTLSYNGSIIDFCAFGAASVTSGGNPHTCIGCFLPLYEQILASGTVYQYMDGLLVAYWCYRHYLPAGSRLDQLRVLHLYGDSHFYKWCY